MRIISGQARGRKLETLSGENTRPTLDSTREALFNMLQTRVLDARVLDPFAGSGALALEAVSRGAQAAVMLELSADACRVIRKNIALVHAEDRCVLQNGDARFLLPALHGRQFDLIFLDPPYHQHLVEEALQLIRQANLLAPDGLISVETDGNEAFDVPEGFTITRSRRYGRSNLHFVERIEE